MKGQKDSLEIKKERLLNALAKASISNGNKNLMFDEWMSLFSGKYISLKALIYALSIKMPEIITLALEQLSVVLLPDYSKNPLNKSSVLSVLGSSGLSKTEIKSILKEEGIEYSALPKKATHLLLGRNLKEQELYLLTEKIGSVTLLTEEIFFDFCKISRSEDFNNPEAIVQMLLHDDDTNVELGIELMKSNASPKDFLTELYALFLYSENKNIISSCEKLLKIYGSAIFKSRMNKVRKEILTPEFESWLKKSGLKLSTFYRVAYLKDPRAHSFFNRAISLMDEKELNQFLDEAIRCWAFDTRPQHISVPAEVDFERFAPKIYSFHSLKELTINIQPHKFLTLLPKGISALDSLEKLIIIPSLHEFPSELQKLTNLKSLFLNSVQIKNMDNFFSKGFTKLEFLKLHLCRLNRLPVGIGNLSQLKVLDIGGGDLTELSSELRMLKNLEELNIENNKFRELPEILFLMTWLKKLKIKNRWSDIEKRNIEALKLSLPNCEIIY